MSTQTDEKVFRILSLDGGGIRGVFPAALLARLEEHLDHPMGRYFDLIAGTSTGGIIAIGLGLGLRARDILKLYVEQGPAIFDQQHGRIQNLVRQKMRGMAHPFVTKHSSAPLRQALYSVLGRRKLGESRTRLLIPAWHPVLERVYIYKTAHHPRLETDYKQPAIDAAMATAAAPTFLEPYMTNLRWSSSTAAYGPTTLSARLQLRPSDCSAGLLASSRSCPSGRSTNRDSFRNFEESYRWPHQ